MKSLRVPLVLVVLAALLATLAPAACLYDRAAIVRGEWWRLVTGHWVHFSASHAMWNLLVLVVAGAWLERVRPGAWSRFMLLAAPLVGLGLFALAPTMAFYGGLSGIAVGEVVLLALTQISRRPNARGWWCAALALVAAKLAWERMHTAALFSDFGAAAIRPSLEAHWLGAAVAFGYHAAASSAAQFLARKHLPA